MLLASGGQRPGMLLNILSCTVQSPQEKQSGINCQWCHGSENCTKCPVIGDVEIREGKRGKKTTMGLDFNAVAKDWMAMELMNRCLE